MKAANKDKDEGLSPQAKTAIYVGSAVVGAAAIGGVIYLATRKKDAPAEPGVEVIPGTLVPPVPIPPIPPIPPEPPAPVPQGIGTAGSVIGDEPAVLEPDEPEADAEPDAPGDANTADVVSAHGLQVDFGQQRITVVNPDAWVAWASPEVAALNVEAWPANELMDNVLRAAFPSLGSDLSSQEGWTINGQPYAEVIDRGQAFIDGLLSGEFTVPKNFPGHKTFARILAGQTYTPLRIAIEPPNNPETGWELYQREKPGHGLHHFLVKFTKEFVVDQSYTTWVWWVWGPGVTSLGEANALKKGGNPQKREAKKAAKSFIDTYPTTHADG